MMLAPVLILGKSQKVWMAFKAMSLGLSFITKRIALISNGCVCLIYVVCFANYKIHYVVFSRGVG